MTEDTYKTIPDFTDYEVSATGAIRRVDNKAVLQGSPNNSGYHVFRLKSDKGLIHSVGRHRAICLAFRHTDRSFDLFVNHINGIKKDDRLENLEWVTPRENVEHAGREGLSSKCIQIEVRDCDTGIVALFPSGAAYSRESGLTRDAIAIRVNNPLGERRVFPERKQYRKFFRKDAPWYIPPDINEAIQLGSRKSMVQMRNVVTGETLDFSSITEASDFLGLPRMQTLAARLSRGYSKTVYPEGYQIRYFSTEEKWPDPVPYRRTREVRTVNVTTGEVQTFASAAECASAFGILPTTLNWRLEKGSQKVFDGHQFMYTSQSAPVEIQDVNSP